MRQCLLCSRQYEDGVQFCPHDGAALPPADQLVGRMIDNKYRVDALQGSGGMGAVYRATQVNLERTVALKVVRGDFLKDAVVTERFKREALAVARLKHPHIVTVYDFGLMAEGGAYLVMEFLDGRTLREEIHKRGRIPLGPAVDLMRQTCSAVSAAHAEGVIHRDLKPDNIFLERDRDGAVRVKILDFGVAKLRQKTSELNSAELTMGGVMLGTPLYMSPEQCQGERLDARSDIYSLGCVFYEMLAGRPPFTGNTATQLVVKHVSEQPEPPSRHAPGIPAGVEAIVMRALAKEPGDRYQTAADLGSALAEAEVPLETQASFPAVAADAPLEAAAPGDDIDSLVDHLFPSEDEQRYRIAVLPFRNLTKDESVDFLSFSLADGIVTELSADAELVVRPTTSVEQYREGAIDQREVARDLDVELLVIGSFLKQGSAVQLNAQLVDVTGNEVIWRHRSTESCDDLLALQDAVVGQVAEGIRSKLLRGTGSMPGAAPTPVPGQTTPAPVATPVVTPVPTPAGDPVARELFEEAEGLGETAGERQQAIELLERAVGLDPDLAAAWSALAARYYSAKAELGKGADFTEKAIRAAERAIQLDRDQLGSVVALGRLLVESGKVEEVARRSVAVIAERPDSFAARFSLGYACRFGGLLDRALRELRLAEQLDARFVAHEIATIYLQKRLYTDALRVLDEANADAPSVPSFFLSALAWALIGDAAGTRDAAGELAKMDPNSVFTLMGQVLAGQLDGRVTGPLLGWLGDVESFNPEVNCWLAQVHAFVGDVPAAAARLSRAISGGYFNYPFFTSDSLLARLLDVPSLAAPLAAARLRHEQFSREFGVEASGQPL